MARILVSAVAVTLAVAAGDASAAPFIFKHAQSGYADLKGLALSRPEGVVCLGDGNVVVADTGNARLVSFKFREGELTAGAEMPKVPQLGHPIRIGVDSKKNLVVLDRKSGKIVRLDPKGVFQKVIDVKGGGSDLRPVSMKVDASDRIYVLDGPGRAVLVLDAEGSVTRKLPLDAKGLFTDVAVDASGTIFAVDALEARVWSADKAATAFTPLSKPLKEYMSFPGYLATTSAGVLLVVDQNGSGIVLLGLDGSYQGRQLSVGASDGLLNYPAQVCLDASGEAFVADRSNSRLQVFTTVK